MAVYAKVAAILRNNGEASILLARFMFLVVREWQSGAAGLANEAKSYQSKPCRNDALVLRLPGLDQIVHLVCLVHYGDLCSCGLVIC